MTKPGFLRSGRAKEEHKVATPCFEPIPTLARSTNDRIVCELGDTPPKHPIYCHISPPKAQNSPKLTKSVSRVVFYMVIDPTTIIEKIFLPPLFRPPPPLALGWAFPSVSHNTVSGIGHKSKERSNLGIVLNKYPNSGSTIFS